MLSSESKYIQVFFRVETTPQLLHPFTFTAGWELRFFTSSSSTAWRAILNSSLYLEIPCWNFSFSLVQSSLFVFLQISEKGGCSSNAFVQGSILLWAKEPTRSSLYPLLFLNWCEYSSLLFACPPTFPLPSKQHLNSIFKYYKYHHEFHLNIIMRIPEELVYSMCDDANAIDDQVLSHFLQRLFRLADSQRQLILWILSSIIFL